MVFIQKKITTQTQHANKTKPILSRTQQKKKSTMGGSFSKKFIKLAITVKRLSQKFWEAMAPT